MLKNIQPQDHHQAAREAIRNHSGKCASTLDLADSVKHWLLEIADGIEADHVAKSARRAAQEIAAAIEATAYAEEGDANGRLSVTHLGDPIAVTQLVGDLISNPMLSADDRAEMPERIMQLIHPRTTDG